MAVDHFATLGLPRLAALDDESIQRAFLAKSKEAHPDQSGGDTEFSTSVNEARNTLALPERRLKHLLELNGQTGWKAVPMDESFMEVFSRLGTALPQAQALADKVARSQSALTKALLASEEMKLRELLESIGSAIHDLRESLLDHLPHLDRRIAQRDEDVWADLQAVQARLSYTAKWQAQVREALLQLTTLLP